MAKFMLIKISIMAEITDADVLRDAAPKKFDAADITSDDYPDSADWHASEAGQEDRRQIATKDNTALHSFVDWAKAKELLDGVPGAKEAGLSAMVVELEGTTKREARDAWGITRGFHGWPKRLSRRTDAKRPEITTAFCTAPRPSRPATLARVRTFHQPGATGVLRRLMCDSCPPADLRHPSTDRGHVRTFPRCCSLLQQDVRVTRLHLRPLAQ
jgi:hypothetical protein